ncbi:MAG: hypothetical protein IID46_15240 [Planctomycetes bacterium]|nr:hypothetical protein [Planctomycetota bacterium]
MPTLTFSSEIALRGIAKPTIDTQENHRTHDRISGIQYRSDFIGLKHLRPGFVASTSKMLRRRSIETLAIVDRLLNQPVVVSVFEHNPALIDFVQHRDDAKPFSE